MSKAIIIAILLLLSYFSEELFSQNTGQKPGVEYRTGMFHVKSKLHGNATIQVNFEIPFDQKTGKPLPTASTMLFMAPYLNDFGIPWEKLSFTPFCREMGWSSFSMVIQTDYKDVERPEKSYYFPETSGFGAAVFEAVEKIRRDFNLEKKKIFIIGLSGGAQLAHRLIMKWPEEIEAIAIQGSGWYSHPLTAGALVPMCLMATSTDEGRWQEAVVFAKECADKEYPFVVAAITPPPDEIKSPEMNHDPGTLCYEMMQTYLAGIWRIRERDGTIYSPMQFALMARRSEPEKMVPVTVRNLVEAPISEWVLLPDQASADAWVKAQKTGIAQQ